MVIKGSLGNGREVGLRADKVTNALITVDYAHHEVHDGSHYTALVSDQLSSIGDHVDIAIAVPGWMPWQSDDFDTLYHVLWSVWSSAGFSLSLYEDVTSFSGGTVQTPQNNNRMVYHPDYSKFGKVSELDITVGTLTRTGGSLVMPPRYFGSRSGGGAGRSEGEVILKAGSTYIVTLEQTVNTASAVGIELAWYESRQKD